MLNETILRETIALIRGCRIYPALVRTSRADVG